MNSDTAIGWNRGALPAGPEQDAVIKGITGEIGCKGFIVANLDKVVIHGRSVAISASQALRNARGKS